ncbi:tRNA U-34 5-methylaminomethyl-2-thiouridine biosynthesis protein [Solibacillus sp. FSL W8-0372]|uniref:tRNA U-34 5-methylaminomethyl-2-thiouridine biosynthesis protein n=1 Tax=Solibacillus sp. FSL W8-0372 TaxID=2921713 RepID=UPI0030CF9DA5
MKTILGLILGSLAGWLIWGYFTNDFSVERLFMFLMGIILGYIFGRSNPKKERNKMINS